MPEPCPQAKQTNIPKTGVSKMGPNTWHTEGPLLVGRGARGGAWGMGVWGDINIHIHINMNIDIHIITNMNIEYYIDHYTLLASTFQEKANIRKLNVFDYSQMGFRMS